MQQQPKNQVHYLEIDEDRVGQRIDNFLLAHLKGVPKTHIYRILRKGEVRVNKKRIKPVYRLQMGDVVRIPPVRTGTSQITQPKAEAVQWVESAILYEDAAVLVLDKPSGVAVHGGSGISFGVIEALRACRPEAKGHYELVHRLDRATSGCLLIAKKRSALRVLHESLREQEFEKRYLALVEGRLRKTKQVLAPLKRIESANGMRTVRVDPDGKPAESIFMPKLACKTSTLCEVEIKTGRTHQIRAHGAHIGHSVAGDDRYGSHEYNRKLESSFGLRRLFLHASELAFLHPVDGTTVRVNAPLPPALQQVVDRLQQQESCREI